VASQFSQRTSWDTTESPLAHAIRTRRAAGLDRLDLTISNPTVCGFSYDSEDILAALTNPAAIAYDPDPKGIRSAREAVAAYYADHQAQVDPEELILTTSTSEAYSFLFRLLCDPGDQVLVAQPSYPLFDFLADLDDIRLQPYPLFRDFGWWIDFAELERRITPCTRAIVLVHPNNPTGHATSPAEREHLQSLCVRHNLALIVDEVFLDYGISAPIQSFASGPHPCLTFVVSGLSKIAALPQMKVGWIACFGPHSPRREALNRLEVIADTFLSMNAPAQHALPAWLAGREPIQRQILDRVRANLTALGAGPLQSLPVEAGWSAILRVPQSKGRPDLAETLVEELGVVVHPGSFYGLPGHYHIVVSLIGPTEPFARGIKTLNKWCEPEKLT
jgi:alanine-synthesizing transaminase